MFLENETVPMKWHSTNKKKYVEHGYEFTYMGDTFYPLAKDVFECSSGAYIPVRCDYCGEIYYPTSRNYQKLHKDGEKDCCYNCRSAKIQNTVQEKYGVNCVLVYKPIQDQIKEKWMEKYGTTSPLANQEIFQKTVDSLNEHYNISKGIKELRYVKEVSDKIAKTNMEKYGGISPMCSNEVQRKAHETMSKNGTCATSQKQIELNNMIKDVYGNSELNYPCDKVSLDCMTIVDDIKIDVEYDGWYYHKDTQVRDTRRDNFVKSQGYKILRILAYANRLPTMEELQDSIKILTTTNKHFLRIELNEI